MNNNKILIVLFDSLRPDQVSDQSMPNLNRFVNDNCHWPNSSCVFPSSTRVNSASLGSGCNPGVHGLVSNKLFDRHIFKDRLMHTGQWDDVLKAERVYKGGFISGPSLGRILAGHDKRMAVICSGSAGTTHMVNPGAKADNQVSLCLRQWESGTPYDLARDLIDRFGPIPDAGFPAAERMVLQTDLFIDGVFPAYDPDVSILWYTEPDWTLHKRGLGSPEFNKALKVLDEQFKRLITWAESGNAGGPVQVIAMSDHGCISAGTKIDMPKTLDEAGFSIHPQSGENALWMASLTNICSIWKRHLNGPEAPDLVKHLEWLKEQPWCGFIFGGGHGVSWQNHNVTDFSKISYRNPRSPELLFTLASDDSPGSGGSEGSGWFFNPVPVGGSIHAGPNKKEMNNFLAMGGSLFEQSKSFSTPAGIVDVAPTVLACLGIKGQTAMDGRVLVEALRNWDSCLTEPVYESIAGPCPNNDQVLRLARMGQTSYIQGAEKESGGQT